jgi:hypothetical protein
VAPDAGDDLGTKASSPLMGLSKGDSIDLLLTERAFSSIIFYNSMNLPVHAMLTP